MSNNEPDKDRLPLGVRICGRVVDEGGGVLLFEYHAQIIMAKLALLMGTHFSKEAEAEKQRLREQNLSPDELAECEKEIEASRDKITTAYAAEAWEDFTEGIGVALADALGGHFRESAYRTRLKLDGQVFGCFYVTPDPEQLYKNPVDYHVRQAKLRMNAPKRGGDRNSKCKWTDAQRSNLRNLYDEYQVFCTDAKDIYETIKGFATWQIAFEAELKAKHPDKEFPSDLIGCLTDLDSYKWTASNLAIEIAARLSNSEYKPFALSTRRLKAKLPKNSPNQ